MQLFECLDMSSKKRICQCVNIVEKEKGYLLTFYINGIMAIIKEWIDMDCKDSIGRFIKTLSVERPSYWWCRFTLFLYAGSWLVWHDLGLFLRGVSRLTIVSKYIDFAL